MSNRFYVLPQPLNLTIEQAGELTGLTPRQITYLSKKDLFEIVKGNVGGCTLQVLLYLEIFALLIRDYSPQIAASTLKEQKDLIDRAFEADAPDFLFFVKRPNQWRSHVEVRSIFGDLDYFHSTDPGKEKVIHVSLPDLEKRARSVLEKESPAT